MSKHPTITKATLADLLAIPEEERNHEIIDGALYHKDAAKFPHGSAQRRISGFVEPFDCEPGGPSPGGPGRELLDR